MTYAEQEKINAMTRANRERREAETKAGLTAALALLASYSVAVFWLGYMIGGL